MDSNNQIIGLKEKIQQKKQAESVLAKTLLLLESERQHLQQQQVVVKKEYEDIIRLEKNFLTSVFHSFLGNKVEKLDKERQEYLAAKLKYEGYSDTVKRLEEEIKQQELELQKTGNPEKEYSDYIQSKKNELNAKNDPEYITMLNKTESTYSLLIEVEEAFSAGEKAYQGLNNAIRSMEKARGWGTFDLIGGGMIATAVKHSHIDDAKSEINHVQYLLKRFHKELNDVKIQFNQDMVSDFDGFTKVADFFFDNLIFDWVVQSRINKTLDNLNLTQTRVRKILAYLKKKSGSLKIEYGICKTELDNYLESV